MSNAAVLVKANDYFRIVYPLNELIIEPAITRKAPAILSGFRCSGLIKPGKKNAQSPMPPTVTIGVVEVTITTLEDSQ